MSGIGVILNPHSKRYRKDPAKLERMGFIVGDRGSFAPTNTLEEVAHVAEEFKRREIDILALSGGDGTNHQTLTTFLKVYGEQALPRIALLRGGTLNTVATILGIKGSPEKLLTELLLRYHQNQTLETKTLRPMNINGQYGFIWGCGVIFNFMDSYYRDGIPSPPKAAWTLAKAIGSALINGSYARWMFARFNATVMADDQPWSFRNYSALYAGSIPSLGLNFRTFYLVESHLDSFHAIGFSLTPRQVLPHVPLMYLGKPSGCADLIEQPVQSLEIRTEEPKAYTIDGDLYPPTDFFQIRIGPPLSFITNLA